MDRLEKLKVDAVLAASHTEDDEEAAGERVGAVVDEFCAEHEVVEVDFDPADPYTTPIDDRVWYASLERQDSRPIRIETIIVSRKVPTLLEAAEGASAAWHQSVMTTPVMSDAMLKLDAAIERERGA